jgi:predicted Ser/Thr protein kinase
MADDRLGDTQKTRLNPVDQDLTLRSDLGSGGAAAAPGARPTIPDVELGEEIGRGGMGVVYRGRQSYIDRRVAVKLLLVDKAGGDEFLKRFQREAKILAGLAHPHIVACYQAGITPEGNPFLVMEYIEGPNLRDWLNQHGKLSERQTLAMVRDLAHALEHASSQGIIHRDVKPENVLLQKRDQAPPGDPFAYQVKLVDLGLARPVSTGGSTSLTMQGVVMGTPATMAPEQFEDPDNVDFKADIYGLGCVMFHALTGAPAFTSPTLAQIVTAKISGEIPDPSAAVKGLSRPVVELARSLLARDKASRPESYRALIARCDALLSGEVVPDRSPLLLRTALAAITVVVVVASWFAFASSGKVSASQPAAALATHEPAPAPAPAPAPVPVPVPVSIPNPVPASEKAPAPAPAVANVPVPHAPSAAPQPAVFGPPETLARIADWTKAGEAQWDRSETQEGALSGVSGEIDHALNPGRWRIAATLLLDNGEIKTDGGTIGIVCADGMRYQLAIRNLGKSTLVLTDKLSADGQSDRLNSLAAGNELHVEFRHVDDNFIEVFVNDAPVTRPIGLSAKALPIAALFLRADNAKQGPRSPLTVQQLTVAYAKP